MFRAIVAGIIVALSIGGATLAADHYVKGYTRSNGTYVAPHYQTNPNSTMSDNYSTRGNVNPYTGVAGTKPDSRPAYTTPSYNAPRYGSPPPSSSSSKPACTSIYGC
jgi:hypothetical protein